jgi:gamma-glutamylcyclotransferase (GGCT)/AIG2-like uncharacterized protein YtfP
MNNTKLYIAYGSNLNLRQMARRCPSAKVMGTGILKDYQLTFRNVATIEPVKGAETPVGVWEITQADEQALDIYEGYPHLYRKETVDVELKGKTVKAMVYIMNAGSPNFPNGVYFDTIAQGYQDTGLDTIYLNEALEDTAIRIKQRKSM